MDAAIRRVESGTHVTVRPGRPIADRSATSTRCSPRSGHHRRANAPALYQRIAAVLDDSVAKHMRADVTVGAFLSGGIDSTAIAALAKRYNPDLMTFTTGFEREGFSEVDVAAESAAAIGVRHVDPHGVSEQELTRDAAADRLVPGRPGRRPGAGAAVLRGQRGPQARQGGAVRRGRRRAVRRLQHLPRADQPARHHRAARRAAPRSGRGRPGAAAGFPRAGHAAPRRARPARTATTATPGSSARNSWPGCCTPTTRRARSGTSPTRSTRRRTGSDPISRMQHVDLFTWLRGDILVKADKMTMANSLELRVPFLDTEVFEVARTIPPTRRSPSRPPSWRCGGRWS